MSSKRDRRRAMLSSSANDMSAPTTIKLIQFGSPRRVADRCTYFDAPAQFAHCFDCTYNRGAQGSGVLCGHRFGLDPTLVDGKPTQFSDGDIVPLDE